MSDPKRSIWFFIFWLDFSYARQAIEKDCKVDDDLITSTDYLFYMPVNGPVLKDGKSSLKTRPDI